MLPSLLIAGVTVLGLVALGTFLVSVYNHFVKLDQQCENSFGQIEIQLKRRYDLIPNLVETARSYMEHERETLERVIAARNQAASGLSAVRQNGGAATTATQNSALQQWMGAEGALAGALGKLSFVMEDYPELKANENIAALMEELTSTENRISFARQAYNDWCTSFNVYRQSFPNICLASTFGYGEARTLIEFADSDAIQAAPSVQLVGSATA